MAAILTSCWAVMSSDIQLEPQLGARQRGQLVVLVEVH